MKCVVMIKECKCVITFALIINPSELFSAQFVMAYIIYVTVTVFLINQTLFISDKKYIVNAMPVVKTPNKTTTFNYITNI